MPMASIEMAIMPAVEPTNTLMTEPTSSTMAPTNSHLPMPDRSRLITVASEAITKNTPAVPAKAVMISSEPFLKPSTMAIMRESIRPMKKVKASSTGTPAAEFLVFSIANMKPKAPTMNTIRPRPPESERVMPVDTPIQAPSTVGSRLSASSQ
jgi:hypothetical protein